MKNVFFVKWKGLDDNFNLWLCEADVSVGDPTLGFTEKIHGTTHAQKTKTKQNKKNKLHITVCGRVNNFRERRFGFRAPYI